MKKLLPTADSPICRHFLVGNCNYGDLCKFAHQPQEDFEPDVCKHFKRGRCALDQECRFKHLGPGGTLPENNPLKMSIKLQTGLNHSVPASRDFLDAASLYTNLQTTTDKSSVCRHYMKNRCSFEKNCRFDHPENINTAIAISKSDATCRHFLRGRCTYGAKCSFSHPADQLPTKPVGHGIGNSRHLQCYHKNTRQSLSEHENHRDHPEFICTFPKPQSTYSPQSSYRPPQEDYYNLRRKYGHSYADTATLVRHAPYSTGSSNAKPERDICRHYLRNQCNYGPHCSFLHI